MYDYLKQFIGKDKIFIENSLLQYYHTWDSYSLSMMYFKFFHSIFKNKYIKSRFLNGFGKILLQNIHPNPDRRFSIHETKTQFKNELIKPKQKIEHDFNDVINSIKLIKN